MSEPKRPRLGRIVNRVCPECGATMHLGLRWDAATETYVRCLVCDETLINAEDGAPDPWDNAHTAPIPEDIRLRLGQRGYRRAPMLDLREGVSVEYVGGGQEPVS